MLSMILPPEVFEYFSIDEGERSYHIHLDERRRCLWGYENLSLTSKGHHPGLPDTREEHVPSRL